VVTTSGLKLHDHFDIHCKAIASITISNYSTADSQSQVKRVFIKLIARMGVDNLLIFHEVEHFISFEFFRRM